MELTALEQFYYDHINANRAEHEKSGKEALDYLEHSTAKYHGKTIYSLYVPKLLNEQTVEVFRNTAETMAGIMRKVIVEYRENEAYRALFGFDKEVEQLIIHDPLYENVLPVCRVDIFYNEADGSFYFCELNTDGSSSMNEDRELCIAFAKTLLYKELSKQFEVKGFELFDSLASAFLKNYKTYPYYVENPNVAVVDFLELGCSLEEFKQFAASFERQGCKAVVCDIRDLHLKEDGLYTKDGMRIDLIYRRAVTSDICDRKEQVKDFMEAVLSHKVCCMGSFCTQVVHDKSLFYILRHPMTEQILTEEENAFVAEHIPYTEELRDDTILKFGILDEKEKWIIKPKNSYGARGIFAGVSCTQEQWETAVNENKNANYVMQQFIMPYQTYNIDFHKENYALRKYSNLTGLYVYGGKFAGVYSRQSNKEIISSEYDENDIATIRLIER